MKRSLLKEISENLREDIAVSPMPNFLRGMRSSRDVIVQVRQAISTWEKLESPNRLMKDFKFTCPISMNRFINDILEYEVGIQHYGKITIDELDVRIEVRTKDIDCVTELDYEYAKEVDMMFADN